MFIWLILGVEAVDETGGTEELDVELFVAGFVELSLEVGLNVLLVEGVVDFELEVKGLAFLGVVCFCVVVGGVWYLGGINRLLSSCRVVK